MSQYSSQQFPQEDEESTSIIEEDSPLSSQLASLPTAQIRLFLDCENNSVQQIVVQNHNFDYLIKQNPFQRDLEQQISTFVNRAGLNEGGLMSSQNSSFKSQDTPIESSPRYKELFLLSQYDPKQKTFPKGILKEGLRRKFSYTPEEKTERTRRFASLNTPRNDGDQLKTDSSFMEPGERRDFRNKFKPRPFRITKSKEQTTAEGSSDKSKKGSFLKKQVSKLKRFLSFKKGSTI